MLSSRRSNKLGCFSFTFSSQDSRLRFLLSFEHNELGSFGALLSHLFSFDGCSEVTRELEVSNGNIIENDVEFGETTAQSFANFS